MAKEVKAGNDVAVPVDVVVRPSRTSRARSTRDPSELIPAKSPSEITAALRRARLQNWRLTLRVRMPAMVLGMLLFAPSLISNVEEVYQLDAAGYFYSVAFVMRSIGAVTMLLAILPSDRYAPRVGSIAITILTVFEGFREVVGLVTWIRIVVEQRFIPGHPMDFTLGLLNRIMFLWICIWVGVTGFRALWATPRMNLDELWRILANTHFLIGCGYVLILPKPLVDTHDTGAMWMEVLIVVLNLVYIVSVGILLRWLPFRRRIQWCLYNWGGGITAASNIAAFIGNREPGAIMETARRSCRCVTLDRVTEEDMRRSTPDAKLMELSTECRLEDVDAFLSHSWHDPPEAKWEALQAWRMGFKEMHKREPRMWIDKYCIDQLNIQASLMCLPVFLAACHSMLILAGPTYLSRLWCVEEIFVYLQMGRGVHGLELISLSNEVEEQVSKFDVRAAVCHLQKDQETLLATIEAGCTTFDNFNTEVQTALQEAMLAKEDP